MGWSCETLGASWHSPHLRTPLCLSLDFWSFPSSDHLAKPRAAFSGPVASLSSEKAGTQLKVGPPGFHLTNRCSEGNNPGPPWVAGRGLAHSDLLECREPQVSSLTSKCPACCQRPSRSFCLENFPLGQGRSVGGKRSFWSVVQIGKWQEADQSREGWRSPTQVPWPLPLSSLPASPAP